MSRDADHRVPRHRRPSSTRQPRPREPPVSIEIVDPAAPKEPRLRRWSRILRDRSARHVAEIGVFEGEFAEALLSTCPDIEQYYMIDPWRHLDDWNKPANVSDDRFDELLATVLARTEPWAAKRTILRGRTTEVIDAIPDGSLDFAYIDGDHTLRGISIDLIKVWPKLRPGGLIGGDDFARTIWQHKEQFEPTLVFPFAVHFAEAHGVRIEAMNGNQFAIHTEPTGFEFIDHTGRYGSLSLRQELRGGGTSATAGLPSPAPPSPAPAVRFRRLRRRG